MIKKHNIPNDVKYIKLNPTKMHIKVPIKLDKYIMQNTKHVIYVETIIVENKGLPISNVLEKMIRTKSININFF